MRVIPKSIFILLGVFLFCSCASYDHRLNDPSTRYLGLSGALSSEERATFADRISYWDGEAISGAPSITIDLSEQRLYYYKNEKLVAVSAVSTGAEGRETRTGHYKIMNKDLHHVSSECGDYLNRQGQIILKNVVVREVRMPVGAHFAGAPMPYYMMIYPGVGMHTGFLPGVPDSHGCIRLPDRMAKIFFEVTPVGTPVTVKR